MPLSHAVCCRPCMPAELPPAVAPGDKPLAVVSYGCHPSTNSFVERLKCEFPGSSVVSGFSNALPVSSSVDKYYPVNTAECCTPALLLDSGATVELQRCDCVESRDVNCGGLSTHRLLYGYEQFRIGRDAALVPVAPAQCCKMCIPAKVQPEGACAGLNNCNGQGYCHLGVCECFDGWTGADCSQQVGPVSFRCPAALERYHQLSTSVSRD